MSALINTIEIKQMAFKWGGVTRVYQTDKLTVFGEEDKEEWRLSNGTIEQLIEGVWLSFQIESNYLQRLSPESSQDNDWIDLQNAIINSATPVTFYPIYSVDPAISYTVISNADGRQKLLETDRALFKPSVALNIKPATRLDEYPVWLRVGRYKPQP